MMIVRLRSSPLILRLFCGGGDDAMQLQSVSVHNRPTVLNNNVYIAALLCPLSVPVMSFVGHCSFRSLPVTLVINRINPSPHLLSMMPVSQPTRQAPPKLFNLFPYEIINSNSASYLNVATLVAAAAKPNQRICPCPKCKRTHYFNGSAVSPSAKG